MHYKTSVSWQPQLKVNKLWQINYAGHYDRDERSDSESYLLWVDPWYYQLSSHYSWYQICSSMPSASWWFNLCVLVGFCQIDLSFLLKLWKSLCLALHRSLTLLWFLFLFWVTNFLHLIATLNIWAMSLEFCFKDTRCPRCLQGYLQCPHVSCSMKFFSKICRNRLLTNYL